MAEVYDDGMVRIDDIGITLRRYYFPTFRAKHIIWSRIQGVTLEPLTWSTGRGRLWGSSLPLDRWWPLDAKRGGRTSAIRLALGTRLDPSFTPADPDAAMRAITTRRVTG